MDLSGAMTMARSLLDEHGLTGWTVRFDSAKRRAGVCRYTERQIGLSAPLTRLHSEDEVRDTILHEIAHALVGAQHGHDEVWRATALRLGCSGERLVPAQAPRVPGAWRGVCPAGHVVERHRRPERVKSCTRCSPRFSLEHVLTWTHHGRPAPMHPNYVSELASLQAGGRLTLLPVGARVRVIVAGEFLGVRGTVLKRGRTSYHVRTPHGVLRVAFAGVAPA